VHGYEQDKIWNVSLYVKYLRIYSTTPHETPSDVPRKPDWETLPSTNRPM